MKIRFFDHIIVTAFTMLILCIALWLAFSIKFLSPIAHAIREFSLSDMYYQMDWESDQPKEYSDDVVIVDITPLYDRNKIADVIEAVHECQPKTIGIDVIFEGNKANVEADQRLKEAAEASGAIFAKKLKNYNGGDFKGQVRSFFASDRIKEAYVNTVGDASSACLRKFSTTRTLNGTPQHSFTAVVANDYDKTANLLNNKEDLRISYRYLDFKEISHDSIFENMDMLKGKIVLIGAMKEERDMHLTPIGYIPGVKTLAYSIQTVLEKKNIETIGGTSLWLLAALVCYITVLMQYHWIRLTKRMTSPLGTLLVNFNIVLRIITFIWLAVITFVTYVLYDHYGYYIPMALILAPVALVSEGRALYTSLVKTMANINPDSAFAKSRYMTL